MNQIPFKSDDFRFVENLNTTVRQIEVFETIIEFLGNKRMLRNILEKNLTQWSIQKELDPEYQKSKGKLSNNGQKTTALPHYLNFLLDVGIILKSGNYLELTNLGKTYYYLVGSCALELKPKILFVFFLYVLLLTDSDAILLLLDKLSQKDGYFYQKEIQIGFVDFLNARFEAKRSNINTVGKEKMAAKQLKVNYLWKSPVVYSEHIIVPRLEWLSQLELVDRRKIGSKTCYKLDSKGSLLLKELPKILDNFQFHDVSNNWVNNSFFSWVSNTEVIETIKVDALNISTILEIIPTIFRTSTNFKLPLESSLFLICFDLYIRFGQIVEKSQISKILSTGITYDRFKYTAIIRQRNNESYILKSMVK